MGITDQSQFKKDIDTRLPDLDYTFGSSDLSHNFNFRSVYEHHNEHGVDEVTTCTRFTKRTVDYIFYHSNEIDNTNSSSNQQQQQRKRLPSDNESQGAGDCLKLIARLKLFSKDLLPDYCIPNKNYPSDHFILAAKFLLI